MKEVRKHEQGKKMIGRASHLSLMSKRERKRRSMKIGGVVVDVLPLMTKGGDCWTIFFIHVKVPI